MPLLIFFISIMSSGMKTNCEELPGLMIKKIDYHRKFLITFERSNKKYPVLLYNLQYRNVLFNHELIQWCASIVEQEQSCKCINEIVEIFLNHRDTNVINDWLFLHDYAILIFLTYKQITCANKITLYDVAYLYNQVSQIPLIEILSLIDQSYEQLKVILSNYPLHDTIFIWLKSYWWVPPITFASLFASFLQWYSFSRQ